MLPATMAGENSNSSEAVCTGQAVVLAYRRQAALLAIWRPLAVLRVLKPEEDVAPHTRAWL